MNEEIFYLLYIKEAFVVKNVNKINVWAWLAILLFVFGCGGEGEKERTRIKKEITRENLTEATKHYEKSKIYDYNLCTDEVLKLDTVGYQLCCKTNNACWDQVDSLGTRLSFPITIEYGIPKMCRNFVEQKDSVAYYACCKRYSACWFAFYDENDKRIIKQLEYEIVQKDSSYYNATIDIKKNFDKSLKKIYKKLDGLEHEK